MHNAASTRRRSSSIGAARDSCDAFAESDAALGPVLRGMLRALNTVEWERYDVVFKSAMMSSTVHEQIVWKRSALGQPGKEICEHLRRLLAQ